MRIWLDFVNLGFISEYYIIESIFSCLISLQLYKHGIYTRQAALKRHIMHGFSVLAISLPQIYFVMNVSGNRLVLVSGLRCKVCGSWERRAFKANL